MRSIAAACVALLTQSVCAQTVLYVDDSAPSGGDGSSWASALNHVTDALDSASATAGPDEIRIAQGVYRPDQSAASPAGTGSPCATFFIPDGANVGNVALVGGFRGIGTPGDPDEYDPQLFETVLSGDVAGNDPAWPFTGLEAEWIDNIEVLLSAARGPVDVRGLRFVGARTTFYDGARNAVGSTGARWWARDVRFADCVFRGSPMHYDLSTCTHTLDLHGGYGFYLGHPTVWNANTFVVAQLDNVVFEQIFSHDDQKPFFFTGAAKLIWTGGGIRDCSFRHGLGAHSFNFTQSPEVHLEDLICERIILGYNTGFPGFPPGLIALQDNVRSLLKNCTFRDIQPYDIFGYTTPVVALENPLDPIDTAISRVIDGCVFENIRDYQTKGPVNALPCFGATLVTDSTFRDIQLDGRTAAIAQRIDRSSFENIRTVRDIQEDDADFDWLFGNETREMKTYASAATAFEIRNSNFSGCYSEAKVVHIMDFADSCVVENCVLDPQMSLWSTVYTDKRALLSRMTVRDNVLGSGGRLNGFGDGTMGVYLAEDATLVQSVISGNRSFHDIDETQMSSALQMRGGSVMHNCLVVDNGFPLDAGSSRSHTAIYAYPGTAEITIMSSTIAGNQSQHVGAVEVVSNSGQVRIVNSIVAGNDSVQGACVSLCPDLHVSHCGCVPRYTTLTDSLTTQDMPMLGADYRPLAGSPAIDAASPDWIYEDFLDLDQDGDFAESIPLDVLGAPRFVDDPSAADVYPGAHLDIGALEHLLSRPACPADTNGDGMLTPADFTAWIAAFNASAPACDQNADGLCTPADFTAWIANYNAGC